MNSKNSLSYKLKAFCILQILTDERYIQRCLELAEKGKGQVSPNPMVGAVLVYSDRIIGEGWHMQYGGPHAEVNCIQSVAEADKELIPESTMYVSLEPCAHYGKTPPCANRLVAERVKKVVICNSDPFDMVAGRGVDILKNNNIQVTTGVLAEHGRWLNRRFFCYHEHKRPYTILKWAQTQDGFIAPPDSSRLAITNQQSNQLVHKWRTEEDAIMVGFNTALNDNPQLTARHWQGKNPLRIAIDKNLQLPSSALLFDGSATTWILNSIKQATAGNIHYQQLDFSTDIVPQLLSKLYEAGIQSIIIEGGAALLHTFIEAGMWDEARVFTGGNAIKEGTQAPVLQNSHRVLQQDIATDQLDLYINNNSHYEYVKGMAL